MQCFATVKDLSHENLGLMTKTNSRVYTPENERIRPRKKGTAFQ